MKIMWVCNILLPEFAKSINEPISAGGSWMVALAKDMEKCEEVNLVICAPYNGESIKTAEINNITYYAIPNKNMSEHWSNVTRKVKPDLIHIHGTEYEHANILIKSCKNEKYVVSIQGLTSIYANHYLANLPHYVVKRYSFRDLLKRRNIIKTQMDWIKNGEIEKEIISNVNNIIGRTTWDKACAYMINPKAKYHYCSESLRDSFYENQWSYDDCEKNSIFISQGTYPIKGLHMAIEALPQLIKEYPNVKVYVAGNNISKADTFIEKIKRGYYGKYIEKLIKRKNLKDRVVFLGPLDEKSFCDRMKKSHVFLSPSSIENSPNSVGEAMILGVPCVSSNVGGVSDMIKDKEEGFLYPFNETYMISYYIGQIFKNNELALSLSEKSKQKAKVIFDRNKNLETTINIYKDVINE